MKTAEIQESIISIYNRLPQEITTILLKPVDTKAERLLKLGFYSNPDVKEHIQLEEDKKRAAAHQQAIKAYYPYKYISMGSMHDIARKYDLDWNKIREFIGDIPDRNLEDIEQFAQQFTIDLCKLYIFAPEEQFKKQVSLEDDPIVAYRLEEGYVIITAWGPETNIQEIVNENNN
jgi:hypothetical protein